MNAAAAVLDSDFARAVIAGLSAMPKVVPARFFYDSRGSELFEAITELPEYYPTRTEITILHERSADIGRLVGQGRVVVEFGAGSARKTPLLLACVDPAAYVPIDISESFLHESAAALAATDPDLEILPIASDFTRPIDLPATVEGRPMLGFFPGSTIGNLAPRAAVDLLRAFAATLGDGAQLVIGLDLRKNPRLLEAAYDDAAGVTATFNLNLLHRINRELGGDIDIGAFEHRAWWNDRLGRIEMHLEARRDLAFHVAGRRVHMAAGETIHTENSYKYTLDEANFLARASGWEPRAMWTDAEDLFSVHVWAVAGETREP